MASIYKNEYENSTHSDGAEYESDWEALMSDHEDEHVETRAPKPKSLLDLQRDARLRQMEAQEAAEREAEEKAEIEAVKEKLNWKQGGTETIEMTTESDEEFPALGAKPKKRKTTPKIKTTKFAKFTKMVLPTKTYREERREQRATSNDTESKRAAAFETLADKEGLEKKLVKTRMCRSVEKGKKCHHKKCRFAHSLDELNISQCFFGDRCRFVRMVDGKVMDCGSKKCGHQHPGETNDDFMARTGLDRFKKKVEAEVEAPTVIKLPKYSKAKLEKMAQEQTEAKARFTADRAAGKGWAGVLKPTPTPAKATPAPTPPVVADEEETVLRVPQELAMMAMKLAMDSGKKRIRVEIV